MTEYRGTVTRADVTGIYVEIPDLGMDVEFGPCETAADATITYAVSDRVLMCIVAEIPDDVVILGKLTVPTG